MCHCLVPPPCFKDVFFFFFCRLAHLLYCKGRAVWMSIFFFMASDLSRSGTADGLFASTRWAVCDGCSSGVKRTFVKVKWQMWPVPCWQAHGSPATQIIMILLWYWVQIFSLRTCRGHRGGRFVLSEAVTGTARWSFGSKE